MKIINLFAVPIFSDKLNINLDNLKKVTEGESYDYVSDGNYYITSNTRLLDKQNLAEEKNAILKKANYFLYETLNVSKKIEFYITTSWIVKFPKNSWGQKHIHSNSIFSGVVYLSTPGIGGEICFHKDNRFHNISYPTLELVYDKWNTYSSDYWKLSPSEGDIILFPSNLTHSVGKNLSDTDRISLAFNVFAKGEFGVYESSLKI
jgi:uncharacterized protein (TIGR02466 family)